MGPTYLQAAVVSLVAGIVVGSALAAFDLPSPAPATPVGVVAGATTLLGMFVGHWFVTSGSL